MVVMVLWLIANDKISPTFVRDTFEHFLSGTKIKVNFSLCYPGKPDVFNFWGVGERIQFGSYL